MNRFVRLLLLFSLSLACAPPNAGMPDANPAAEKEGVVLSDVPEKVDARARYLFYLHGYIVEAGNTRPVSPKFGVYEYEKIVEALRRGGFVVISEARKKDPEIEPYAAKVAEQVRRLLKAGVPPRNITVVGASQGGWIGMLASTYLKDRGLNFVVIGACGADEGFLKMVDLHGNVLFIVERTDKFPSARCRMFLDDATGLGESRTVETNTGQRHGFLYRPLKEWVGPTIAWAKR
jgi:pimeloyl-ACP methyl ester carboxylesterase